MYKRCINSIIIIVIVIVIVIIIVIIIIIVFRLNQLSLKWYYDQKIISFFSSDFESVFA